MKYVVEGGVPLKGKVKVLGAKNASFKLMIAALLSNRASKLENISFVRDVVAAKQISESLGAKVDFEDDHNVRVEGKGLSSHSIETQFGELSRASTLFIPILLHRLKKAKVPFPGGDKIGERPLDRHFQALESLGARVKVENNFIEVGADKLVGTNVTFAKNTHTGTEMLLLAAVLAEGKTTINNAAAEPEVDDLISFLNKMGARITRIGDRFIEIEGVKELNGTPHQVLFDRNETVTFACFALGTRGDVTVLGAKKELLQSFLDQVDQAGGNWEEVEGGLRFYYTGALKATQVQTAPHPGFMTDWQAIWATLMTQAKGVSIIHETVFENRFTYIPLLEKFGAEVRRMSVPLEDPEKIYNFNWTKESENLFHAAAVSGPTKLHAASEEVTDIRTGATLCLAALIAEGQSNLSNIELIERGYENLDGRLRELGAKIFKTD
jgi:UDP-N-acetylglucosamine 1-carboxyvinyltransferase